MFLVPSDTPGINVLHHLGLGNEDWHEGSHAHVRYENVRVPTENLLGGEGNAFEVAQRRLGGGRIHHAMRSIAGAKKMFDMMCERALSRYTQGIVARREAGDPDVDRRLLDADRAVPPACHVHGLAHRPVFNGAGAPVRGRHARCWPPRSSPTSAMKATHIHGALGVSNAMSLGGSGGAMGLVDGPTEVHKFTIARQVLKDHQAHTDGWPSQFRPRRLVAARHRFEDMIERAL